MHVSFMLTAVKNYLRVKTNLCVHSRKSTLFVIYNIASTTQYPHDLSSFAFSLIQNGVKSKTTEERWQ